MSRVLTENELWILSFYRTSEINGALFFGRLARAQKPGAIQHDLTKHFSDEALHAWYWTSCIERFGQKPLKMSQAYQDRYLEAAGIPANLMEILAITYTFEKRVMAQYGLHRKVPSLPAELEETFSRIMEDERWHIAWVTRALEELGPEYGRSYIDETLARCRRADEEVYRETLAEHAARIDDLIKMKKR